MCTATSKNYNTPSTRYSGLWICKQYTSHTSGCLNTIIQQSVSILPTYYAINFAFLFSAPYIKQCREDDPKLTDCIISAINHVKPWMAKGIPEVGAPGIEPFVIDELSLSLTSGPNGYKIILKNLEAFGASNYTIDYLK